jgi:hypothetical protein
MYPNINAAQSMLQSDNPIDTPTISPLVKTILLRGGPARQTFKIGEIVVLSKSPQKVNRDVNYHNCFFWKVTPNARANAPGSIDTHLFVLREGLDLQPNEYKTVSVAVQDAVEVSGNIGWYDVGRQVQLGRNDHPIEGRHYQASVFPHLGFRMDVTYIHIGPRGPCETSIHGGVAANTDHTHWVCIHPAKHGPDYGVYRDRQ